MTQDSAANAKMWFLSQCDPIITKDKTNAMVIRKLKIEAARELK
jgi:hypothetical protein